MNFTPLDLFVIVEIVILFATSAILVYKAKQDDGKVDVDEMLEILNKLRVSSVKTINEIVEAKVSSESEQKKIINNKLLEIINSDNSVLLDCEKELLSTHMSSVVDYILEKKKTEEKLASESTTKTISDKSE